MMAREAAASRPLAVVLSAGWLVVAALAAGVLFALSAFAIHPLAFPLVAGVGALALVTLSRPEIGIAAALVLVPLGNLAFGYDADSLPNWLPITGWSAFLFAVAVARGRHRTAADRGLRGLGALVLAYLVLTVVAAVTVTETLEDAFPVVRSLTSGLLLLGAIALTIRTRQQVQWILGGAALSIALVGGYACWQYATGAATSSGFLTSSGSLVSRAEGAFAQPNQLGGYLLLLLPFAIAGAATSARGRLLFAAAALLGVLGIYVSFSRGALVALIVIPFVFARGRQLLAVALVLALAGAIATPSLLEERFVTLTASGPEVTSRVDFWQTAASIWAAHPILGVGPGGFPSAYAEAPVPGKSFLPETVLEPPPHAHNVELHTLAEGGTVGFALLLTIVVVAARASIGARRSRTRWVSICGSAGLAAMLAFLVHNQFDVTLAEGTGTYFWGLLGLMGALAVIASSDPQPAPAARASDAVQAAT